MKQQAQKILDEAVDIISKSYGKERWSAQTDPFLVDAQLAKVRMELARLELK